MAQLSQSTLERVLDAACSGGSDYGEIFWEDTRRCSFTLQKDGISGSAQGRENGVGIRLFSGLRCYYAYTNDLREQTLLALTRELTALCGEKKTQPQPLKATATYEEPVRIPLDSAGFARKLDLCRQVTEAGQACDPEITQVSVRYLDEDRHILVANSLGFMGEDHQPKTRMLISAYACHEGNLQNGYYGPGAMGGLEFYEKLDLPACARRAAEQALSAARGEKCPSGLMPVVVDHGFGGLMFHEACGHSLEASSVAKGHSEFSGKLGEQVASPLVTLIDDGSLPGEWGSLHMDDEGIPTRRNVLIHRGILRSYMIDRLEGRRMGMAPTGSCRRQNYRFCPESRMTNTFIAPGESTREQIISATEKGLYVGNINGGSVNPATGDFNFNVLDAWLIENGRITRPVYGATLIGNGAEVLKNVDMVGNNLLLGQGYCYNNSGALYINAGQPTLRVKQILVGGLE